MNEKELTPEMLKEELEKFELDMMQEYADKLDVDAMSDQNFLTPMEHKLIGSTWPGKGYHPNLPIAFLWSEISLELINQKREISTAKLGGWPYYDREKNIYIMNKLFPLTEEDVENESPILTFRPTEGIDLTLQKNKIPLSENFIENFKHTMQEAQDNERERLLNLYLLRKEK